MLDLENMQRDELRAAFKKFDYNGNGLLSLAEIDLCLASVLPQFGGVKSSPYI